MSEIISWDKAIDKKVKSSDDKDLGKVKSITQEYIQTKEGTIGKKYYYIPKYYLQGYDGDHLWVSLTKDEVQSRFEGEKNPLLLNHQNICREKLMWQSNILILDLTFQHILV